MNHTRRTILSASAVSIASMSGCIGELRREAWELTNPQPEIQASLGFIEREPYVEGQPTFENVPEVYGVLATELSHVEQLVTWDDLPDRYREFTPSEQFLSIVVGALWFGYGLTSLEPARLEDGVLKYRTEPYRAHGRESGDPEYSYDYTFTLWNLNGLEPPEDVTVSFTNTLTEDS